MTDTTERRTPLAEAHEVLGASFTDFSGWQMPLKYTSDLDEHRAVREKVGLFDLSHMGEIRVTGPDAGKFLDYSLISALSAIKVGKAKYSMIVQKDGGIIDDLITYRLGEEEYLVVPNAGNAQTVFEALTERSKNFDVKLNNETFDTALVAVQGPKCVDVLDKVIADEDRDIMHDMSYYSAAPVSVAGVKVLLARTGYTGEDGFELYVPNANAKKLWDELLGAGKDFGLLPCGLAARDSLRLEAGMPLYGHELNRDLTPVHAGLKVLVGKNKEGDFFGKGLREAEAPQRKLIGLRGTGRRAARAGSKLMVGDTEVGEVTSGQLSPTLGYPIALAYIDREQAEEGAEIEVDVRGKRQPMTVVKPPFYKRG